MKLLLRSSIYLLLSFLLIACQGGKAPSAESSATSVPVRQALLLPSSGPLSDYHFDRAVLTENTAFLTGTGDERSFLCCDILTQEISEIELPVSGSLFSLGVSPEGDCLIIAVAAHKGDDSGGLDYSLLVLDTDGRLQKEIFLDGVRTVNFLAVGTPLVNGCAMMGEDILLLVNNRLLLLDAGGDLLDYVVWAGSHPHLAACMGNTAFIYEMRSGELLFNAIHITDDKKLHVEPAALPAGIVGVIPSGDAEHCWLTDGKTVYSFDAAGRFAPRWEFPYGYSAEKEYFYNGGDLLLELYHGRVGFFSLADKQE